MMGGGGLMRGRGGGGLRYELRAITLAETNRFSCCSWCLRFRGETDFTFSFLFILFFFFFDN